ncbi:protease Do-like 5, chloroplastic isoform X2 [Papaver somniferum]|uniref:protease Do-like 5, chloroplastic isoform X2 n=1 Tax=Papaver somniferum TaxID=3469 RepID=UPI000E6FB3DF|nr:protease Do-like 5, chloroplastic isoform X2 [Papaver somniferum]
MVVVLGSIHHQFITKSTIIISANISSSSSVNKSQRLILTRRKSSILATSTILSSFLHLASFQLANAREEEAPQRQEERVVQVFEEASPSVVFIKDLELVKIRSTNNEEVLTKEEEESAKVEGTGSGFIWDKSGHIVTNYHVIAKLATDTTGLQRCKVFLEDAHGQKFSKEGKLVGFDPTYDLAVLKIQGNFDLKPALIGTSGDLRVGQNCFAIGNPYGYENTLTTGVVSGLAREIPSPNGSSIRGAIQTDAAINAGNSGGPLINSYGHVIGVNTSTFTRKGSGQSSGVNFAIPIDTVVRTVPYLIVYGTPYSNSPELALARKEGNSTPPDNCL